MAKILLDYFFNITAIESTPEASTAFLKNVLAIVKPKVGATEDTITLCTTKSAVDAFSTTNVEVDELFDAGMNRVYVVAVDDLTEIGTILEGSASNFYTILVTSDFSDAEFDAAEFGDFEGVIGMASTDDAKNATRAATISAWHSDSTSKAKNMFYAFGKLLSNTLNWKNQQYITVPYSNAVTELGDANTLFDSKISFVITDDEFGKRVALFAHAGEAIVKPYILKNLRVDMQSAALTYISGNQPDYNNKEASLLEDELDKVIQEYINDKWITAGTVEIKADQGNFVASGNINVAKPKAFWRIFGEMSETL